MAYWQNRVDLSDLWESFDEDDPASFEFTRDQVVDRLRQLPFAGDFDFDSIVYDLESSPDLEEFNRVLDDLYDFGDVGHRLWIGTF